MKKPRKVLPKVTTPPKKEGGTWTAMMTYVCNKEDADDRQFWRITANTALSALMRDAPVLAKRMDKEHTAKQVCEWADAMLDMHKKRWPKQVEIARASTHA